MPPENEDVTVEQPDAVQPAVTEEDVAAKLDALTAQLENAQKHITDLNAEAARRRHEKKQAEAALEDEKAKKLVEQERWQELADQRQAKLAELEPFEERAKLLEERLRAYNDHRIQNIPETMRSVIPADYPPEKLSEWLDANADKLSKPAPPSTDAGAGRGSGGTPRPKLPPELQELARETGMSEEDMFKNWERSKITRR